MSDSNLDNHLDSTKKTEDSVIGDHKMLNVGIHDSHDSTRTDNLSFRKQNTLETEMSFNHFGSPTTHINKLSLRFETSLSLNLYQIKDMFDKICRKKGFMVVDDEGDHVTAIKRRWIGPIEMIKNCITGKGMNCQDITAIALSSKVNKTTCKRRIQVKALYGNRAVVRDVLNAIAHELEHFDKRSPTARNTNHSFDFGSGGHRSSRYIQIHDEEEAEADETNMSLQNLESYSFYEFRKILSSEQYTVGQKVSHFLRDFFQEYKNIEESSKRLPEPLEQVYMLITQTTETFFADHNYGKSETKKIMPYCRMSVEKFIFDKVYEHIFSMYKLKYAKQSQKYITKAREILQDINPVSHLQFLDIPRKFWLIPNEKFDSEGNLIEPLEEKDFPYRDAYNEMNKLSKLRSPREKLSVLLMMHSLMRSSVVDFYKGKEEVSSMDEELPLTIFILLYSRVEDLVAELNFIDDYVSLDPTLESEKRLMTNIKVSVDYIANDWERHQKK